MSEYADVNVISFEMKDIARPGRVYSHLAHDGTDRRVVAFNEPVHLDPAVRDARWSGLPVMFLYVSGFEEALALAREIAAAHKAGNVDAFIGRWKRENDERRRAP